MAEEKKEKETEVKKSEHPKAKKREAFLKRLLEPGKKE